MSIQVEAVSKLVDVLFFEVSCLRGEGREVNNTAPLSWDPKQMHSGALPFPPQMERLTSRKCAWRQKCDCRMHNQTKALPETTNRPQERRCQQSGRVNVASSCQTKLFLHFCNLSRHLLRCALDLKSAALEQAGLARGVAPNWKRAREMACRARQREKWRLAPPARSQARCVLINGHRMSSRSMEIFIALWKERRGSPLSY